MIIDGKALSLEAKDRLKRRIPLLKEEFGRVPCLAVVMVGENPASLSYVKGKVKAAAYVGIGSRVTELPETVREDELLDRIKALNEDDGIDGILVQLPLPGHVDEAKVIDAIALEKDVDGFHPGNVAKLWLGRKSMVPCTPKGIIRMIEASGTVIAGKKAVVVGRSNIVGKPVAKLLLDRDASVTIVHSKTADLKGETLQADILIAAAGCPGLIGGDMIKPGATVIDVGISRTVLPDGSSKLAGDVRFDEASKVAGHISPVPGGVGPMTIAMLLENTVECFLGRMQRV